VDVVLDVDTGVDDALALLLAVRSPHLRLRAVTCVAGNVAVDQVVANTLRVLDAAGAPEVPVARGADRPLLEPAREARHVHGADGLADVGLPVSRRAVVSEHAVELLRHVLTAAPEPVTLVPLAPLTNIALLLRTYPEVIPCVRRVVLMGGAASVGNATASAEFNVFTDPEAAAVVLGSGLPVTMYGLDVFYGPAVPAHEVEALVRSEDPGQHLAGLLLRHGGARNPARGATLGDAGAVAAVIAPDGLRTERHPVHVELAGRWTRGRTVVDSRPTRLDRDHDTLGTPPGEADVALAVDGDAYTRLFLDTLRGRQAG